MTKQYTYKLIPDEITTRVQITPEPDWDDFKDFVSQFITEAGAELKVADYGMDRHQIDYELDGQRYLMHYEHYTQSVWIEKQA